MKYSTEIEINCPRDRVIALFDDPDNLLQWMEGLQRFEHLSGTAGEPGAQSRLTFKVGKREMTMIETITARNLPDEFSGVYDADGMRNTVKNRFVMLDEQRTLYIAEHEFQCTGVMRIVAFLMPGLFKKESHKHLIAFKAFAERHR